MLNVGVVGGFKCSKKIYKIAEKDDVDFVIHVGDVSDGLGKGYRGHEYEIVIHDGLTLIKWLVSSYPKSAKPTFMISGNHDIWPYKQTGLDIVESLCEKRNDLYYLGRNYGRIKTDELEIAIHHPNKASAQTFGYDLQKFVKILKKFGKYQLTFLGNFHKACMLVIDERVGYLVPTLKSTDEYFITRGLTDSIGAWEVEIESLKGKIVRITSQYFDFRDKTNEEDYKEIYKWLEKKSKDEKIVKIGKRKIIYSHRL